MTQTSCSIHAQSHLVIYEDVNCVNAAEFVQHNCFPFFYDFVLPRVNLEQMLATALQKRTITLDLS